jgi:hypothetical protein
MFEIFGEPENPSVALRGGTGGPERDAANQQPTKITNSRKRTTKKDSKEKTVNNKTHNEQQTNNEN